MNKPKIWIALDVASRDAAESVLERFSPHRQFKVGLELFTAIGPQAIVEWTQEGLEIFLDLKLHDIPNTVNRTLDRIAELGVSLTTIHSSGGMAMMKTASRLSLAVVGVTLLTSLDETDTRRMGWEGSSQEIVRRLTDLAHQAHLAGVVASAGEVETIQRLWPAARIVVPGLRWGMSAANDQARVATPGEAWQVGATDLVVGRALTARTDFRKAYQELMAFFS